MNVTQSGEAFPLDEARELTRDLMRPQAGIYWADFTFHMVLGWAAFYLALISPAVSAIGLAAYLVAGLALYRAVIFTHELAHLKKGTFKRFRLIWNLTCGFPLMVPSFTYHGVHNDHHTRDIYGQAADGEYLPFAVGAPHKIIAYMMLIFVLPLLFAVRFMILAPLGWVSVKISHLLFERLSSLTIDLGYRRVRSLKRDDATWPLQEFFSFLYGWSAVALVLTDVVPARLLLLWYLVAVLIFFLNSLRTLAAHAYRNPGDQPMSVAEQFLDSVDVPGQRFLTALWAPVGLRYHATHHLFPGLPYHNLARAYRRLEARLSDNHLYLAASRRSLWRALSQLWREAARSQRAAGEAGEGA